MSLTLGSDITVNYGKAGFIPGFSNTSPDGLSRNTPPSPPYGQSQTFDRLLQKIGPVDTSPLSPPKTPATSAAAHQSNAGADHKKVQIQNEQVGKNEQNTYHRQRSYNQRTAGLSSIEPQQSGDIGRTSDSKAQDSGKFSIWDVIDIINPLHHLPIVGTLYRSFTGDQINPAARVLGGAIYGGPIGAVASMADNAIKGATGKDFGENVMAAITPNKSTNDTTEFASAEANTIQWSQPQDGSAPLPPPRLTEINKDEIIWAGPRTDIAHNSSPPLHGASAARQISPETQNQDHIILASVSNTHSTYPMQGTVSNSGALADHSLHTRSKSVSPGANPSQSIAQKMGERDREEVSYARQENVGSPSLLNLQEASAEHKEPHVPPEPIAAKDISLKMIEALDKYKSLKLEQHNVGQK